MGSEMCIRDRLQRKDDKLRDLELEIIALRTNLGMASPNYWDVDEYDIVVKEELEENSSKGKMVAGRSETSCESASSPESEATQTVADRTNRTAPNTATRESLRTCKRSLEFPTLRPGSPADPVQLDAPAALLIPGVRISLGSTRRAKRQRRQLFAGPRPLAVVQALQWVGVATV